MGILSKLLYFAVHPNQLRYILLWKLYHKPAYVRNPSTESDTLRACFKHLYHTSRSFALVVQELPPSLALPVIMYYLALRGLDTIEDDMTLPLSQKIPLLRTFSTVLEQDGWTFNESGPNEKDRSLLVHFDDVITEFKIIDGKYRDIIRDITHKMGNGMADFAGKSVETVVEYELYCHYVAGLVGEGLTRFFLEGGFADPGLGERPELSESMGQFLQKTNIIRDVREDFDDQRRFWPREIWGKHVDEFEHLFDPDPKPREQALACSSEMVLNALKHVEDCLVYMAGIKEQGVFNFVAIPQVMAIATLELVFQNPRMFETNVKITRGDAAQLMTESSQGVRSVAQVFKRYVRRIHKKNSPKDPNFLDIGIVCGKIEQFIESTYPSQDPKALASAVDDQTRSQTFYLLFAILGVLLSISALVIGTAYCSGASLNKAIKELTKGTIFSS